MNVSATTTDMMKRMDSATPFLVQSLVNKRYNPNEAMEIVRLARQQITFDRSGIKVRETVIDQGIPLHARINPTDVNAARNVLIASLNLNSRPDMIAKNQLYMGPVRTIPIASVTPEIRKRPHDRNFEYSIKVEKEGVAFNYRFGADTIIKNPINLGIRDYVLAKANSDNTSIEKGNSKISLEEFREILTGGRILEAREIPKRKSSI